MVVAVQTSSQGRAVLTSIVARPLHLQRYTRLRPQVRCYPGPLTVLKRRGAVAAASRYLLNPYAYFCLKDTKPTSAAQVDTTSPLK